MTAAPIRMTASPCPEKDRIFFALSVPEPNVGILPLLRNQSFHTENVCNGYCFTYLLRFVFFVCFQCLKCSLCAYTKTDTRRSRMNIYIRRRQK
jgi:hypothetical protein